MLSCDLSQDSDSIDYKFFVAGHVYGAPAEADSNIGVHPPFKRKLPLIKEDDTITFGFFTGDIVFDALKEDEWEEVDQDISYLEKTVYFAPGNHDVGSSKKRSIFTKRYGATYQSFVHKNDLFIILDPNMDKWNISGEQLDWLKEVLSTKKNNVDNVFVFFHQLLWWEKDNIYSKVRLNSSSGRGEKVNFFPEVNSLFEEMENRVYMFAGDIGMYDQGYMYHKPSNVSFIASGMGGRKEDNFLIVNVNTNKEVEFDLIMLNGENMKQLRLVDYELPE